MGFGPLGTALGRGSGREGYSALRLIAGERQLDQRSQGRARSRVLAPARRDGPVVLLRRPGAHGQAAAFLGARGGARCCASPLVSGG
ncbi:hypothetical protein [Amycolatopsis plumensis]|uniref:hypothetical protein n=1 Tax=Amycolatopsis plumensis TaxID=236508 RepID=UPI0036126C71